MNNIPILTIAIPTFNRAGYLELCLKSISEEILNLEECLRGLVEVYVSDNASSDNTCEITSKYQLLNVNEIKVVRNDSNIGADKNIAQCYDSATTEYVWILGDDDLVLPGGLAMVLESLISHEIDILYLNNFWFTDSYTERPFSRNRRGVLKFEEALPFASRTNVMLTFISALVVRRGVGLDLRHGLMESRLVQFSWILPLLRDGKCFAVIEDIVVAARGSNSGGYGLVNVFGNNLVKITNEILKDKIDVAKVIQNGAIVNFFPDFIISCRKGVCEFSEEGFTDGLKDVFADNWRYYIFLAPLALFPLFFAVYYNLLLKVFRRLFSCI